MKLFCFDQNQGKNESGKKLHKGKTPKATSLTDVGDVADWVDHLGGGTGELGWEKKNRRTAEGLGPLKTTVDTKQRLNKARNEIDKRGNEKLNYRERLDIYGTKECQEWYSKSVKESLETLKMGDKLHDFIMAHPKYAMGQHVRWNSEFAKMINISPPDKYKGANDTITNRRIAVAAQQVMIDYFNSDVFKLVSTNGWDEEDGKVGPYTTRVLREYWTSVHSKTSKKKPQPPTASDLGGGYSKKGPNAKKFAVAVASLAALMLATNPDVVIPGKRTDHLNRRVKSKSERVKEKYAKKDKAGSKLKTRQLKIDKQDYDTEMSLEIALKIAFEEKTDSNRPDGSPKTYRVLHLLAQEKGAAVDRMKIGVNDSLSITSEGLFTLSKASGKKNRIQLPKKA